MPLRRAHPVQGDGAAAHGRRARGCRGRRRDRTGVTRVKVGDRVSCSYIPVCGKCRYCSTGKQNLCDAGLYAGVGCLPDKTFRFHQDGEDFGGMCVVGSFAEYAVLSEWSCVKIEDYVPMEIAALVSCGVTTGFCSAIYAGDVRVGDVAVIFGTGGVGMNAVQGARYAGAKHVIAIDPNPWKQQQALDFGATHAFGDPVKAKEVLIDLTRGQLADKVICTVGEMDNDVVKAAVDMTGKAGTIVMTGVGLLRDGAARRHPHRLPPADAGLAVRRRQPALRHPDDPQPLARGAHQAQRAHHQEVHPGRN